MTQPADRNRANLEAILQALLPELIYLGVHEYNVVSVSDGPPVKITARTTDPRLPDLVDIVLRPDSTGGRASPTQGASILIGFIGGNAQRPYVHSLDPTSVPSNVHIDAATRIDINEGGDVAARKGDHVHGGFMVILTGGLVFVGGSSVNGYYPATQTGLSNAISDAGSNPGAVVLSMGSGAPAGPPLAGLGVITDGSAKVHIG